MVGEFIKAHDGKMGDYTGCPLHQGTLEQCMDFVRGVLMLDIEKRMMTMDVELIDQVIDNMRIINQEAF